MSDLYRNAVFTGDLFYGNVSGMLGSLWHQGFAIIDLTAAFFLASVNDSLTRTVSLACQGRDAGAIQLVAYSSSVRMSGILVIDFVSDPIS